MGSRRRGDVLEAAILEAAWAELGRGWQQFAIESVAERAGTGKAAIYRRWPDRVALARAAAEHEVGRAEREWISTGDLRADLLAFAHAVAEAYDGPLGQAVRGIVAATGPLEAASPGAAWPGGRVVASIVAAAGLRVDGDQDQVAVTLNLGISLISYQTLVTGRAPGPGTLVTIVETIWLPALERVVSPDCERDVP